MSKKRGQVTTFIILGIIVIAGLIGGYFAKDYITKSSWERSYEKSLVVPKQAETVKNYIDSCISDIAIKSVDLAGQQGGYIVIPEDQIKDPLDRFSNSLTIFSGFRTPYWYYKAHNNIEVTQKPSLNEIEEELSSYLDSSLRECLDFSSFSGYKIKTGNLNSKVEIKDNEVLFTIDFPVNIELKDFKFSIKDFYSRVEAPLGSLYKEASKIYEKESSDYFLEQNAINVLVSNDKIPVTGVTRDCGKKIWARRDVESAIKEYVPLNIQMLRVKGTNYGLINPKEDYYVLDAGIKDNDMDVSFYSSSFWPYEIEIIPTDGELLEAQSLTEYAGALEGLAQSFFCMNYYQFLYNMKFPTLVILSKDGYTLKFATQVVIEKNEARKATLAPITVPEVDTTFCENRQSNLDVSVFDDNGNPVNNVDIKFKCLNVVCNIGKTLGYSLKAPFPPCVNGIVIASKEGYNNGKAIVSTNEPSLVSITLAEPKEVFVEAKMSGRVSSLLENDETIFISMINSEEEFSSSLVYPDQEEIKLIPGNYEVYIYALKDTGGITVQGEKREVCTDVPQSGVAGWFGAKTERCVTVDIPSTELESVMVGGARFNMYISSSNLRQNNLVFYVPYKGVPKDFADLANVNLEVDKDFIYPKFE